MGLNAIMWMEGKKMIIWEMMTTSAVSVNDPGDLSWNC